MKSINLFPGIDVNLNEIQCSPILSAGIQRLPSFDLGHEIDRVKELEKEVRKLRKVLRDQCKDWKYIRESTCTQDFLAFRAGMNICEIKEALWKPRKGKK